MTMKMGTYRIFPLVVLLLSIGSSGVADAAPNGCELNPYDAKVEAKLSADAKALELRTDGGGCRIALDCTVKDAPVRIHYELATLVQGKVAPYASQMTTITFEFAGGARQSCRNAGTKDLD